MAMPATAQGIAMVTGTQGQLKLSDAGLKRVLAPTLYLYLPNAIRAYIRNQP